MSAPDRPRPSPGFVLVNTAFLWVCTAVAATALWPIYRTPALVVLVLVSLLVGSGIAILGSVLRWSSPVVLLATVAAFLIVGVPLAVPAKARFGVLPTWGSLVDLVTGVALGWKQLLTITLPVGDYQALLVPALVLVLVTVTAALSVALRTRSGELGVLGPIVVFLVATAFGPQHPDRPLEAPVALLVAVLAWLVWWRWYRRRRAIRLLTRRSGDAAARAPRENGFAGIRTAVGAALILALASAGAIAATAALPPAADRTVLRTAMVQPFDPRDYLSPLAGFRRYWQPGEPDRVLFEVAGLPQGGRLRLATLDTWDGVVYSVGSDRRSSASGSFTRVPLDLDQSAIDGTPVTVQVSVVSYAGVWLPTVGQLESIRFEGPGAAARREAFFYNDLSGTAAVVGGLQTGDAYRLTAVVPRQPAVSELSRLTPGSAHVPEPRRAPEPLTAALEEYTAGLDSPGERLVAALDGLAAEGYVSHGGDDEPPSRSGHAADRIAELFSAPRMIGDAEQYAVAASLMAQELGFPARVVVGFAPEGALVRGDDVAAWIEVSTAQDGWVAIDPTPPTREIPEELPEEDAQVARPQTVVPPPVTEDEPFDRQSAPDSEQELPPDLDPLLQAVFAVLRVTGWVLLGGAILISPFLLVIVAKLRRRRLRRRAATPRERISGGWQEFEDAVVDHGLDPAASATRSEVATLVGGARSQVLAAVTDRAVFAPGESAPAEADEVWRAVDQLRAELDQPLTRWQRLRAKVSVRSLGGDRAGYSVTRLFKRVR